MKKCILLLQAIIVTIFLCSGHALGQSKTSVLSLDQARQLAGAHNRDLQSLYLNLLIAQDKTREARSKALPQLGSSITYTAHQEQPRRSNLNDGGSMPVSDQQIYEACVSVNQALFNLGIWAGIKGAVKYQQMKKLKAERFQETLHYLVSEQYLVILRIQQEHSVLRELEKNTQEHLRDTQNFYQEGLVPKPIFSGRN